MIKKEEDAEDHVKVKEESQPEPEVEEVTSNGELVSLMDTSAGKTEETSEAFDETAIKEEPIETTTPTTITKKKQSGLSSRCVDEQVIQYSNTPPSTPFPPHEDIGLHHSRIKEVNQLLELYKDLGPRVTGEYSATLAREIARNRYERETVEEYELIVGHLNKLASFCRNLSKTEDHGGRTQKMVVLEALLEQVTKGKEGEGDDVGVIFVERRITALALHCYFRDLKKKMDVGVDVETSILMRPLGYAVTW